MSPLTTPIRNRYFHGKLLDVPHLDLEQAYGNRKRWLVNRLALGSGVVCGLDVAATAEAMVQIGPGFAVDRHGREIVVPAASPVVDPRQPTDDHGRPVGKQLAYGTAATLYLAYHECAAEHVPATGCGCDGEPHCEAGAIHERYRILVVPEQVGAPDPQCSMPDLWSLPPGGSLALEYSALAGRATRACAEVTGDGRVPLATVVVHQGASDPPVTVDIETGVRPVVYTNEALLEAMVCLAGMVGEGGAQQPSSAPPKITATAPWTHAGVVSMADFLSEGLQVSFDRPLNLPAGPPIGWFLVSLEYDRAQFEADPTELIVRRVNPSEVTLADDRKSARFQPYESLPDWLGHGVPDEVLCRVVLKSHVLADDDGRILDGDFLGTTLPTGDGVPGGDFESWFTLTIPKEGLS